VLRDRCDAEFVRRALRRRLDLRVPYGLLLVCGPDCDPGLLGRVIAARVPRAVAVPEADGDPPHTAVVLPAPTPSVWSHALLGAATEAAARTGLVVSRAPVHGLRALRAAYFAAVADAGLAIAIDAEGPMVTERELVVPRMLAALGNAEQDTLLEPLRPILALPSPQRRAYVRTLDALHRRGGTQAGAASILHIHPNTVRYRIDRIEELTRMHLDNPSHRMLLDLAAMLVVLRGQPPDRDHDFGLTLREEPEHAYVRDIRGQYLGAVSLLDSSPPGGDDVSESCAPALPELAGALARVDHDVGTQPHQGLARAQRDHLGKHPQADPRLGQHLLGLGLLEGHAFAVAAPRLDEAGGGAVAAARVARLEGVVALATDLADLDCSEEAVSTHAAPGERLATGAVTSGG
jgi:hypothetical protein